MAVSEKELKEAINYVLGFLNPAWSRTEFDSVRNPQREYLEEWGATEEQLKIFDQEISKAITELLKDGGEFNDWSGD